MNNTATPHNDDKPFGYYEQNTRIICENTLAKPKKKRAITIERVMEMCERDEYEGICIACGEDAEGVEPDARKYECESCGKEKVYGCQELLFMVG